MQADKRIRTVLYGDQKLTASELDVIHTPSMQRLYGLRQLGLTDRVFIDASHSRIHHVVGVIEQVDKLVNAIVKNLRRNNRKLRIGAGDESREDLDTNKLADHVEDRREVVRFIGLLHDLTHAPFGHTVEDEIGLVESKHDDPDRQADAFYRLLCQLVAWLSLEAFGPDLKGHTSLTPLLSPGGNAEPPEPSEVANLLRDLITQDAGPAPRPHSQAEAHRIAIMFAHLYCALTALLHLEVLHKAQPSEKDIPGPSYRFQELVRIAFGGSKFEPEIEKFKFSPRRDAFMLDIVGNTVCADLLDYARRDCHNAGLRLDCDPDRIAENFTIVSVDALAYSINHPDASGGKGRADRRDPNEPLNPFTGWCFRTAISLVSHKYRTDVPSELMNLLNVRYYLYERVIYHPTKCAAGSMLGTALQLLGWRKTETRQPDLPKNLRFVGDDVFLHDITAALDIVIKILSALPDGTPVDAQLTDAHSHLGDAHNGLVPKILDLRAGERAGIALTELRAARLLLNRLMSRRYFRPIFRALPSSIDKRLQAGPESLSGLFLDPDVRYKAEREIEEEAGLPIGTITIHCPTRTTAKKIANVFLTKPGPTDDGTSDPVFKLKDIESLDKDIFGEHQKAVKAVERMYGSMWRLNVYLAPEHLARWERVSKDAGKVIFRTVDNHNHFADGIDIGWPNDSSLISELTIKIPTPLYYSGDATEPNPLSSIAEIGTPVIRSAKPRVDQVHTVIDAYVQINKKNTERLRKEYTGRLSKLTESDFEEALSMAKAAVAQSRKDDERTPSRKGHTFPEFLEILDDILRQFEDHPGELFEEKGE